MSQVKGHQYYSSVFRITLDPNLEEEEVAGRRRGEGGGEVVRGRREGEGGREGGREVVRGKEVGRRRGEGWREREEVRVPISVESCPLSALSFKVSF